MEEYDVIVVGLSCAGLSTAYYCAKKGLKVLGLEQYSCPGSVGASSFGETRMWCGLYDTEEMNKMARISVKLWKELEEDSGEKLIHTLPYLCIGTMKSYTFRETVNQFPHLKLLSPEEIYEKYPAIKNLPSDYKGLLSMNGGVVQAKTALKVTKELAEIKYGAKFIFNTKVNKFDKNQVQTDDGTIYNAKHVVMTCGVNCLDYTTCNEEQFKKDIGYAVMSDSTGMPGGFLEIPSLVDKVKYLQLCRECYTESETFQYKTDKNGVHFAYSFSGEGFCMYPLHGKIIYEGLINKIDQTYIPPAYRAKL